MILLIRISNTSKDACLQGWPCGWNFFFGLFFHSIILHFIIDEIVQDK